jgi:hypothetical protein
MLAWCHAVISRARWIAKGGSTNGVRACCGALTEAAWLMLRYNPWARSVFERLVGGQKTLKKKAIVALARKLLVLCWAMLLRNEPWQTERQPAPGDNLAVT